MLFRIKDGSGGVINNPGQIVDTNVQVTDTDGDGQLDTTGLYPEVNDDVWWFEAEHHYDSTFSVVVDNTECSNSQAVVPTHVTSAYFGMTKIPILVDDSFVDFHFGSSYRLYVRAKAYQSQGKVYKAKSDLEKVEELGGISEIEEEREF